MFDLIEDYQGLFKRRMEGLLLGEGNFYFNLDNFFPHSVVEDKIL